MSPGTHLGKYEIIKRIATGGMAELFLARTVGLMSVTKVVVIKRILPNLASQTEFVEMFIDEARIAATLQHPNVVQLHDVFEQDGNYYIAMEYLHGQDARALVFASLQKGKKLPLPVALHIVAEVAAGLHYAHEKTGFDGKPLNIVHRDITPQNVVVTYDGHIKLVDFGIAKASNRLADTRAGTLKGKVSYMSPEQTLGRPLDRRSDVFTLGILLFELTTCRRMFRGANDFEVFKQIAETPLPRPNIHIPDYPEELERIMLRSMERDPAKRYATARELQLDLERFAREHKLPMSATNTSAFISEIFGEQLEAWREASVQGKTMVQLLDAHLPEIILEADDGELSDAPRTLVQHKPPLMTPPTGTPQIETPPPGFTPPPSVTRPRVDQTLPLNKTPRRTLALMVALPLAAAIFPLVVYLQRRPPTVISKPIAVVATPPPSTPVAAPAPIVTQLEAPTAPPAATATAKAPPAPAPAPTTAPIPAPPGPTTAPIAVAPPAETKPAVTPKATKRRNLGRLVVGSKPWVNVVIDGTRYGRTPVVAYLAPGSHTVIVNNPSKSFRQSFAITVHKGKTTKKLVRP